MPETVAEIGQTLLKGADREYFLVICLSTALKVNAVNIVSQGSINHTSIHPREVFKPAILANSDRICLLHNHIAGNLKPSEQDINVTKKLIEAGNLLDIKVIDHIIITDSGFVSLKIENEYLF